MATPAITHSNPDLETKVRELTQQTEDLQKQLREARTAPVRHRLPATRASVTHKFTIGTEDKGYVTVGSYEDGRPPPAPRLLPNPRIVPYRHTTGLLCGSTRVIDSTGICQPRPFSGPVAEKTAFVGTQ